AAPVGPEGDPGRGGRLPGMPPGAARLAAPGSGAGPGPAAGQTNGRDAFRACVARGSEMTMNALVNTNLMLALIGLAGIASAGLYARRRQFIDAVLVLLAAAALGLFAAGIRMPGDAGRTLDLDPAAPAPALDGVRAFA